MKWQRRTEIVGGVPFTSIEAVPEQGGPIDWNGGCVQQPPTPPPIEWSRDSADPAWQTVTLEDGASLFFGKLGD